MRLGIIGKPQSGKTTVFNAASGQQEAVGDFSNASHKAVIKVPDIRVDKLADIVQPKKITYAEIEFLDAPGISGKGKEATEVEFSSELRQVDALMVVLDAFTDDCDPKADFDDIMAEMILSDQVVIENNIEKKERKAQLTGDKSGQMEVDLLKRCLDSLEKEQPLIELGLTDAEQKSLRGYTFLTLKPLLLVLNIAEDEINTVDNWLGKLSEVVSPGKYEAAAMCGKIEMELVTLEDDDKVMFMEELGITTPAVELVIQKSYDLLGLVSYLTAGEPEVRAWTITKGTIAHKAAGVIHSDIERGFIRAEVIAYDDYLMYPTPAEIKAAGKMRLEGKEYIVKDGDVILFRFNV